jgi:acetyltransferase-like isoleucine patch superfamily enzyme
MNAKKLFIYSIIMFFIPPTRLFNFKRFLIRWCGAKVDENVRIVSSARFNLTGDLTIGKNTFIGHDVIFVGGEASILIGENCDVAPRVIFVTGSHKIDKNGERAAGDGYSLPITIGNGSWICTGAIVLGGTNLGLKSIVSSGSVVKGIFEGGYIIAGSPAKKIRKINDEL